MSSTSKIPLNPDIYLIFPHKKCGRCGGTGEYSQHQIHGTTCLRCKGAGIAWNSSKIRTAVNRYCIMRTDKGFPSACRLQAGDRIWIHHKDVPKRWRTVASVESNGDKTTITFAEGLRYNTDRYSKMTRSHDVDWRTFAEEAGLNVKKIEEELERHYSSK